MRKVFRTCLAWGMLLGASVSAMARQAPEFKVTLCVYDYAGLPAGLLKRALKHTQAILGDAGVALVPVTCTQQETSGACHQDPSPLNVSLRVVRGPIPGSSAEAAGSETGPYIAVNYSRVEYVAKNYGVFPDRILGCVIAHELGHVLLGSNSHSSTGIMTAHWTGVDLQTMHWSLLWFAPSQKERLRTYLISQQQPKISEHKSQITPVTTFIALPGR